MFLLAATVVDCFFAPGLNVSNLQIYTTAGYN
jgi:hypothetical protein